jgi:hypothetical protein
MLRFANDATPFTGVTVVVPDKVPAAGLAAMATVTPPVKPVAVFPNPSRAVTSTAGMIVAPATVVVGCVVMKSAVAAAGVTVTAAVCVIATPLTVAEIVLACATVELNVVVKTPAGLVVPAAGVS